MTVRGRLGMDGVTLSPRANLEASFNAGMYLVAAVTEVWWAALDAGYEGCGGGRACLAPLLPS